MQIELTIGQLADAIEKFKQLKLQHEQEIKVDDLEIMVPTPIGHQPIRHFIKKEQLQCRTVSLADGRRFTAAEKHIVVDKDGKDLYVNDLQSGTNIKTRTGLMTVVSSYDAGIRDCYDIGIDAPHVYYDAAGILHHNTIISAVLSHKCEPYGRTVIIVPNTDLIRQTEADYKNLGLDVGVFYGGRKEYTKTHTICTWQSLNSLFKKTKAGEAQIPFSDFIDGVVCVMVDEAHGLKADALLSMMTGVMAHIPIRWAFTGTIPKEEFEFRALQVSVGEVIGRVAASDLQEKGVLSNCHINIVQMLETVEYKDYQSELKYLLSSPDRLMFMSKIIVEASKTGNTLVLVDRIQCGETLAALIPGAVFVNGSTKSDDRKEQYATINTSENSITIATFGVAAVGINIPRIYNLFIIEPGKSFVRVIQSIGRGLRKAADKDHVEIFDVCSSAKFSKRHLTARKKFYAEAQYPYSIEKVDYKLLYK